MDANNKMCDPNAKGKGEPRRRKDGSSGGQANQNGGSSSSDQCNGNEAHRPIGSGGRISRLSPPRSLTRSFSLSSSRSTSPNSSPSPSSKDRRRHHRSYVRTLSSAGSFGGASSACRRAIDAVRRAGPSSAKLLKSSTARTAGRTLRRTLTTPACLLLLLCVPIIGFLSASMREQNRRMADMEAEQCRTNGRLCLSGDAQVTGRMCTAQQQLPLPWTAGVQYTKRNLRVSGGGGGGGGGGGSNGNLGMPFGDMGDNGAGDSLPSWEDGPLVCIVVTTYNVERYVVRALDSILQQTYKNFEVLVVDDASTDATPAKVNLYADADPRFRLLGLTQSTLGGAGQPTNIGIDSCSDEAEFVLIVDGDDWMERDALSSVVSHALRFHSDVVVADFDTFEQDDSSTILDQAEDGDDGAGGDGTNLPGYLGGKGTYTYTATVDLFNKTSIELFFAGSNGEGSESKHAPSRQIKSPFIFSPSYDRQHWEKVPSGVPFNVLTHPRILRVSPVPWRKLYRRGFINGFGLRFPEGDYFYEDNTFHWLVMGHASRVSKIDRVLFHHRRNRKGQTSASYSKRDSVGGAPGGERQKDAGGAAAVGVELRPGEDNASDDDDENDAANAGGGNDLIGLLPVSEQEAEERDQYWQEYYKSSRLGGYFPNIHSIGRKIFEGYRYEDLTLCAKVAVADVARMYFNWVRASSWIAEMQKSPQMTEKFKRLLGRAESHWNDKLVKGGFDVDVGVTTSGTGLGRFLSLLGRRNDVEVKKTIDLSLILPTKDVANLLPDLLRDMYTALTRSRLRFEVFVVDDGSTDGTVQFLRDFAAEHPTNFYLLESNSGGKSGAGRARNSALPLVEGEYVYFADADDTFDFAALAGAVRHASRRDVDVVILPYKTEYIKPGKSTVDGMLSGDLKIWNSMRSKWREWVYPYTAEERKAAAFGLINYPWKQLTAASLLRDAGVFFGPTVVQNDVQFHWTSIAAAKNVRFYDVVVCTHRKFDEALRSQLTKVSSSHRLGMLDAAGMTQRAMARQGAFDSGEAGRAILAQWTKFFRDLASWAKGRVPKEDQALFVKRRDNFLKALEGMEPYSLGKWEYWQAHTGQGKRVTNGTKKGKTRTKRRAI